MLSQPFQFDSFIHWFLTWSITTTFWYLSNTCGQKPFLFLSNYSYLSKVRRRSSDNMGNSAVYSLLFYLVVYSHLLIDWLVLFLQNTMWPRKMMLLRRTSAVILAFAAFCGKYLNVREPLLIRHLLIPGSLIVRNCIHFKSKHIISLFPRSLFSSICKNFVVLCPWICKWLQYNLNF